ncbi:MAG: hypothetical protein ACTIIZ_06510, partial [Levilactobacillus brevis]
KMPTYNPQGSPPHLWGILLDFVNDHNLNGITPTPVGNTYFLFSQFPVVWDHPHTCGEYTKENLLHRHSHFSNATMFITLLLSSGRHGCLTNKPTHKYHRN